MLISIRNNERKKNILNTIAGIGRYSIKMSTFAMERLLQFDSIRNEIEERNKQCFIFLLEKFQFFDVQNGKGIGELVLGRKDNNFFLLFFAFRFGFVFKQKNNTNNKNHHNHCRMMGYGLKSNNKHFNFQCHCVH